MNSAIDTPAIQHLYHKRDTAIRRYKRTDNQDLLEEFFKLRRDATDSTERSRTTYIHQRLRKTLDNNGNFWKELRSLGLLPKSVDGLQGFTLDELNDHFAAVSFSTAESSDNATEVIKRTPVEGFSF